MINTDFFNNLIKHLEKENIQLNDLHQRFKECNLPAKCVGEYNSTTCSDCLRNTYFNNNEIVYSCNTKTYVYTCHAMPCHVSELYYGMNSKREIFRELLDNDLKIINAISFGSGSGTDMLALLKYFIENKENNLHQLNILRIDKNSKDWDCIFDKVVSFYCNNSDDFNIVINSKYQNYDVLSFFPSDILINNVCNTYYKFNKEDNKLFFLKFNTNIVVLSYLASELKNQSASYLDNVVDEICHLTFDNNFLLLINDIDEEKTNAIILHIIKKLELKLNDKLKLNDNMHLRYIKYMEEFKHGNIHAKNIFDDNLKEKYQVKLNMRSYFRIIRFTYDYQR